MRKIIVELCLSAQCPLEVTAAQFMLVPQVDWQ